MLRFVKVASLATLATIFLATPAFGATYYVDADGSTPGSFTTLAACFADIAIGPPGPHRVEIKPGNYTDAGLTPPDAVVEIDGLNAADVVFTGNGTVPFLYLTDVTSRTFTLDIMNLTIEGYDIGIDVPGYGTMPAVTVHNCAISQSTGAGVRLQNGLVPHANNVTISSNEIFNNGGDGVWCGGDNNLITGNNIHGNAGYAVSMSSQSVGNTISGNCFDGHPGAEGYDDGSGNSWSGNYYDDYAPPPTHYVIAGAAVQWDMTPVTASNTAVFDASPWEIGSEHQVDFEWTGPGCYADKGLSGYEFTVTYNPAKVEVVDFDYYEIFGPPDPAFYDRGPFQHDPVAGTITFTATNPPAPVGDGQLAWINFKVIATDWHEITMSSTYLNGENNPIATTDNAPGWIKGVDTQLPVMGPVSGPAKVSDSDAPCLDAVAGILLTIDASATDNYNLDRLGYKFDNATFGGLTYLAPVTGISDAVTAVPVATNGIGLAEGAHTIYVWAMDAASNWSATPESHDFEIDRSGPVIASVTLTDPNGCADAGYTNEADVVLAVTGDATEAFMRHDFNVAPWVPDVADPPAAFVASQTITLPALNASNTVRVVLYDDVGNCNWPPVSASITHDDGVPTISSFIAGPPDPTSSPTVNWSYNASGERYYKVHKNAGQLDECDGGWVVKTTPPAPYTFPSYTPEAENTLRLAVKDRAGNVSTIATDQIWIDDVAPVLTKVRLYDASDNGADCSDSPLMNLKIWWTGDATWYRVSEDGGGAWGSWIALPAGSPQTVGYTFSCCWDQTVEATVQLSDNLNNFSNLKADDIWLDNTVPTMSWFRARDKDYDAGDTYGTCHFDWTNDLEIYIKVVGSDNSASGIVGLLVSEDAFVTPGVLTAIDHVVSPGAPDADTLYFKYTITSTDGCPPNPGSVTISGKAVDCAGKESAVSADNINIDLPICSPPVITSFTIDAYTNDLDITATYAATDDGQLWAARVFEVAHPAEGEGWRAHQWTKTYTLFDLDPASNDGIRDVNLELKDKAGNITLYDPPQQVEVDMTVPEVAFEIVSNNPDALEGWTDSKVCDLEITMASPDAYQVRYRGKCKSPAWTGAGTSNGWQAMPAMPGGIIDDFNIDCGGAGTKYVEMQVRDPSNNKSAIVEAEIEYDPSASPPLVAVAQPGESLCAEWSKVANAQAYMLRFRKSNEYPYYTTAWPVPPAGLTEGTMEADDIADTCYVFPGPATSPDPHDPDCYAISVFTLSKAGVWSGPNDDILELNYFLGDFVPDPLDGEIVFTEDIIAFAARFGLCDTDVEWDPVNDPYLDVGPTSDGTGSGLPMIDGCLNLWDAVTVMQNYNGQAGCCPKMIVTGPVAMSIDLPGRQPVGTQFTVSLRVENPEAIAAFHLAFEYDRDNFDVLSVKPGTIFESVKETMFYVDRKSTDIDFTGVVFGADAFFQGDELAQITFKSKSTSALTIEDVELTVRDKDNQPVEVTFMAVEKASAAIPTTFALSQNYPNPFNPATSIELSLPVASDYKLTIYNILGQPVKTFQGYAEAGYVTIRWDANGQSSGIYMYKVVAGTYQATRKMVLLK